MFGSAHDALGGVVTFSCGIFEVIVPVEFRDPVARSHFSEVREPSFKVHVSSFQGLEPKRIGKMPSIFLTIQVDTIFNCTIKYLRHFWKTIA